MPLAETQMATVLSNADPQGKGRVRVRMNWQTDGMQIRVNNYICSCALLFDNVQDHTLWVACLTE